MTTYRRQNKSKITANQTLKRVYTPPKTFETALNRFGRKLLSDNTIRLKQLIVIPIVVNLPSMTKRSPKDEENLYLYNSSLKKIATTFNHNFLEIRTIFHYDTENFGADDYHLSYRGNSKIGALIKDIVK